MLDIGGRAYEEPRGESSGLRSMLGRLRWWEGAVVGRIRSGSVGMGLGRFLSALVDGRERLVAAA